MGNFCGGKNKDKFTEKMYTDNIKIDNPCSESDKQRVFRFKRLDFVEKKPKIYYDSKIIIINEEF